LYESFKKFITDFKKTWDVVENYQDLNESKYTLEGLFGENYVNEAFSLNEKYTKHHLVNEAENFTKAMSSGSLTLSGINSEKKYTVQDKGGFYGQI